MPESQKRPGRGRLTHPRSGSEPSGWSSITRTNTRRSGRPSSRSRRSCRSNHETLRRSGSAGPETDAGDRPGLTTDERAKMKDLEREVKELRRANEILASPRPISSGRSSTARVPIDRRIQPRHRDRFGVEPILLPGAHRARLQDRPEHVLGGEEATAIGPSVPSKTKS